MDRLVLDLTKARSMPYLTFFMFLVGISRLRTLDDLRVILPMNRRDLHHLLRLTMDPHIRVYLAGVLPDGTWCKDTARRFAQAMVDNGEAPRTWRVLAPAPEPQPAGPRPTPTLQPLPQLLQECFVCRHRLPESLMMPVAGIGIRRTCLSCSHAVDPIMLSPCDACHILYTSTTLYRQRICPAHHMLCPRCRRTPRFCPACRSPELLPQRDGIVRRRRGGRGGGRAGGGGGRSRVTGGRGPRHHDDEERNAEQRRQHQQEGEQQRRRRDARARNQETHELILVDSSDSDNESGNNNISSGSGGASRGEGAGGQRRRRLQGLDSEEQPHDDAPWTAFACMAHGPTCRHESFTQHMLLCCGGFICDEPFQRLVQTAQRTGLHATCPRCNAVMQFSDTNLTDAQRFVAEWRVRATVPDRPHVSTRARGVVESEVERRRLETARLAAERATEQRHLNDRQWRELQRQREAAAAVAAAAALAMVERSATNQSSEEAVHCDICYDDEPPGADTVWRLPYCSHTLCYTCAANMITAQAPPRCPTCRAFMVRAPSHYVFDHAVWAYDALVRTCISVRRRPQHPALPLLRLLYDPHAFTRLVDRTTEWLHGHGIIAENDLDWVVPTVLRTYDSHGRLLTRRPSLTSDVRLRREFHERHMLLPPPTAWTDGDTPDYLFARLDAAIYTFHVRRAMEQERRRQENGDGGPSRRRRLEIGHGSLARAAGVTQSATFNPLIHAIFTAPHPRVGELRTAFNAWRPGPMDQAATAWDWLLGQYQADFVARQLYYIHQLNETFDTQGAPAYDTVRMYVRADVQEILLDPYRADPHSSQVTDAYNLLSAFIIHMHT